MGYRSNLTAGLGHGDEVYGLAPVVKDAQRRAVLPELTKCGGAARPPPPMSSPSKRVGAAVTRTVVELRLHVQ